MLLSSYCSNPTFHSVGTTALFGSGSSTTEAIHLIHISVGSGTSELNLFIWHLQASWFAFLFGHSVSSGTSVDFLSGTFEQWLSSFLQIFLWVSLCQLHYFRAIGFTRYFRASSIAVEMSHICHLEPPFYFRPVLLSTVFMVGSRTCLGPSNVERLRNLQKFFF